MVLETVTKITYMYVCVHTFVTHVLHMCKMGVSLQPNISLITEVFPGTRKMPRERKPGGGVLGSSFAGYVPLASQNPYPIIVYSVVSCRPHLSHFWANVTVISRMEFKC